MIDNIKFRVSNNLRFEKELRENELIDLETTYNYFTGEIANYPKKGRLENLEIRISEKNAYLKGSLHKYFNNCIYNEDQNHNDFSFCELRYCIDDLTHKFKIEKDTKLTNLEFGFNIHTSIDPSIILNNHILMFDLNDHNRNLKFQGKGNFKEFIKSDYSLKIYDKDKQYKKVENILRIELKIIKSRELEKHQAFSLDDLLNLNVLNSLYNRLMGIIGAVTIVDDYGAKNISFDDIPKLKDYTNPNYWIKLRHEGNYKRFNKKRTEFKQLIENYNLDTIKQEIIYKLNEKFINLKDCESFKISLKNIA